MSKSGSAMLSSYAGATAFGFLIFLPWSAGADLDPAIQADLYVVQAEEYVKQKNYAAAQSAMGKILALAEEHDDVTIPVEFHYKYADGLESAGQYHDAMAAVTQYLQIGGVGGAHYRQALTLLHTASQNAAKADDVAWNMTIVVVPAGSYLMGSPSSEIGRSDSEGRQRRVTIREPFAVGVYEVTFKEWNAWVSRGGSAATRRMTKVGAAAAGRSST